MENRFEKTLTEQELEELLKAFGLAPSRLVELNLETIECSGGVETNFLDDLV